MKPYTFDRHVTYTDKAKEHIRWAFASSYQINACHKLQLSRVSTTLEVP